jgi:peptide deformylase
MNGNNLVLTYENPMLRKVSQSAIIGFDTVKIIKQCNNVLDKVQISRAVSAVQLGYPIQLFVCKDDPWMKEVINPELLASEGSAVIEEGCLSVPDVFKHIQRADKIKVRYQKQNGRVITQELTGVSARVFLHEFDHLKGKLIIDYPEVTE